MGVRPVSDPVMHSRPNEEYSGRYWSVDANDIEAQRAKGWTDFHPEEFCHRCGCPNVSWYVDSLVWNDVMRGGSPEGWGDWQEIICVPCFMELAEAHYGACTWRIIREPGSLSETLILSSTGVPDG